MSWYFTFQRVSEYAWRYGYILRHSTTGFTLSCSLDRTRILASGTLPELAHWVKLQITAGRDREPPTLAEMEGA